MISRRGFLRVSAAAVGAIALGVPLPEDRPDRWERRIVGRMGEHRMIRRMRVPA